MKTKCFPSLAAGLQASVAVAAMAMLSACGGGGGGVTSAPPPIATVPPPTDTTTPQPSPPPTPVPTPTPPPPPPLPTTFDTAEVRRSDGPEFHNAIAAWQQGMTGAGATIAIVDSGIDPDNPEFAGRITASSADVAGNRGLEGPDAHGTHVALVAAAALNGAGVVGIAYNANIMALRADEPGSCPPGGSDVDGDGCTFVDRDIAAAVDRARTAGATVVNLSLGGGAPGAQLRDAVRRAVAAGVVIIVAAGNDGDTTDVALDPSNPDPFALGIAAAGSNHVIIVGSVDEAGQFSDFSNAAGNSAGVYLTARGERICCIYENGELKVETTADGSRFVTLFSGTSFSAPQVSGAVALLKQAFPNLSGREMVEILLSSARDAGAVGLDPIYGRGILDIARAFQPQGTTTLAGGITAMGLGDSGAIGSAAMGDALDDVAIGTLITDKYDRAFSIDLGSRLHGANIRPRLIGALESNGRRVSGASEKAALAFSIGEPTQAAGMGWARQLQLTPEDAEQARVLAARMALQIAPGTRIALGYAESASGIVAQLQGQERAAFLIAPSPADEGGFARSSDVSLAVRREIGPWGFTLSAESGEARLAARRFGDGTLAGRRDSFAMQTFGVAADRRLGPVEATFGLSWMSEDHTLLGAYFHEAFGANGSDTMFLDGALGWRPARDWRIGAAWRHGVTNPRNTGLIASGSSFSSDAWSLDVTRYDLLTQGDSLGFRLSQPLRVSGGGLSLNLPQSFDYATETAAYGIARVPLAPRGRELDGEISWSGPLLNGRASASLFYRREPGHVVEMPDDAGVAVKWRTRF